MSHNALYKDSFLTVIQILGEITNCKVKSDQASCYVKISNSGKFSPNMCESLHGYPPRFLSQDAAQELWNLYSGEGLSGIWVGLTTPKK